MWTPDLSKLVAANESSSFVIAAWHELFDAFTPDTFQPRIHNIPSLVRELEDLSSRLCENPDDTRWMQHIQLVKEECRALIGEEQQFLREIPEYDWLLARLIADDDPRNIRLNGAILQQRQSEFESRLCERLDATVATLPRTKTACHKSLRAIATLALQQGKEDDDLLESEEFDASLPVKDIVGRMKTLVDGKDLEFECVFVVTGSNVPFLSQVGFNPFKRRHLPQDQIQHYRCVYGDNGFQCFVTSLVIDYRFKTGLARRF